MHSCVKTLLLERSSPQSLTMISAGHPRSARVRRNLTSWWHTRCRNKGACQCPVIFSKDCWVWATYYPAKKIETVARTWHRRVIYQACTRLCLACVPVSIFLARVVDLQALIMKTFFFTPGRPRLGTGGDEPGLGRVIRDESHEFEGSVLITMMVHKIMLRYWLLLLLLQLRCDHNVMLLDKLFMTPLLSLPPRLCNTVSTSWKTQFWKQWRFPKTLSSSATPQSHLPNASTRHARDVRKPTVHVHDQLIDSKLRSRSCSIQKWLSVVPFCQSMNFCTATAGDSGVATLIQLDTTDLTQRLCIFVLPFERFLFSGTRQAGLWQDCWRPLFGTH